MKLSAIVLSKGEESTHKAVKSVDFTDEVIVVLDSKDTLDISSDKVKIVKHELAGDFAQQRNYASTLAKGEWLLYIDADEVVSKNLQTEIVATVNSSTTRYDAYRLRRRDFFWNKEIRFGETQTARNTGFIRLVKKNSGTWKGSVHEKFVTNHKESSLHGFIDHYPHQTVSEFLFSINNYSSLRAKELKESGVRFSVIKMVLYPLGKFIYTYFFKLGFLDGAAGFVYSFMMSFHTFLVRAKLMNL